MQKDTLDANRALAYLILRLGLGVCILLHGIVRISIFSRFVDGTVKQFAQTILPSGMVHIFAVALPFVETLIGLLLVLGLATRFALIAGALFMFPLLVGMNLLQQWFIVGLQLGYVAIYALLLAALEWNLWSVDGLFGSGGSRGRGE